MTVKLTESRLNKLADFKGDDTVARKVRDAASFAIELLKDEVLDDTYTEADIIKAGYANHGLHTSPKLLEYALRVIRTFDAKAIEYAIAQGCKWERLKWCTHDAVQREHGKLSVAQLIDLAMSQGCTTSSDHLKSGQVLTKLKKRLDAVGVVLLHLRTPEFVKQWPQEDIESLVVQLAAIAKQAKAIGIR